MENNSDKIYYYTSNYVLLEWLKNEKIWATRSVSSNDSLDTIYIIEHLEKLKAKVEPYIKINLENVESLLVSSRYWSLSVLKDVLTDSLKNNTQVFLDIVQNVKMGIEQGKTENQAEKIVLQEIFNSLSREGAVKKVLKIKRPY